MNYTAFDKNGSEVGKFEEWDEAERAAGSRGFVLQTEEMFFLKGRYREKVYANEGVFTAEFANPYGDWPLLFVRAANDELGNSAAFSIPELDHIIRILVEKREELAQKKEEIDAIESSYN